jgi:hypothetical protein
MEGEIFHSDQWISILRRATSVLNKKKLLESLGLRYMSRCGSTCLIGRAAEHLLRGSAAVRSETPRALQKYTTTTLYQFYVEIDCSCIDALD